MDLVGRGPADGAGGVRADGCCTNSQCIGLGFDTLNGEPARSKRYSTTHDDDSLPIRRSRSGQIASALSLSPKGTLYLECAPAGGQFRVHDLTPLTGLLENGSHG